MDMNISVSGPKRLLTRGKYCDRNIVVTPEGVDAVLQEKTVTKNGVYTPDTGYNGMSKVTVNVSSEIPDGYVLPSGTKTITANGTHDVSGYANAKVNVPLDIPDGYVQPTGSMSILANGTYSVAEFAYVEVLVPTSGGIVEEYDGAVTIA